MELLGVYHVVTWHMILAYDLFLRICALKIAMTLLVLRPGESKINHNDLTQACCVQLEYNDENSPSTRSMLALLPYSITLFTR